MRRHAALLTICLFLIWILPLGIFIKPSQEKITCDGQRAICMCHHMEAKVKRSPIEGYGFKGNSGSNKESSASSGGAGNYYLASNTQTQNVLNVFLLNREMLLAEAKPFLPSIEHVPKV